MTRSSVLALALGSVVVIIHVVTVAMAIEIGSNFWVQAIPNSLGAAVGLAAVLRSRTPRMGWIMFAAFGLLSLSQFAVASDWALARGYETAAAWWYLLIGNETAAFGALAGITLSGIMMVPVLYPDGHLPSRRWMWYPTLVGTAAVVALVTGVFGVPVVADRILVNPIVGTRATEVARVTVELVIYAAAVLFLLSILSLGARFKRGDRTVQQQIKWFAFGVGLYAIFLIGIGVLAEVIGLTPGSTSLVLDAMFFAPIPISIGIAMFRYRLFEIDRIVSRTVSYALVLALVFGAFGLLVTAPSLVIGSEGVAPWQVALATLLATALFNPLRLRMQRVVDRRFDRNHYDAQIVVDELGGTLQESADMEAITIETARALDTIIRPESVAVWLRLSDGE